MDPGLDAPTATTELYQLYKNDMYRYVRFSEIIVLRILQNWSTEEAAHILGWSEAKVRTTLHRAIEKLRSLMSEKSLLERGKHDVRRHS